MGEHGAGDMHLPGSIVALSASIVLFVVAMFIGSHASDGSIKTSQACDARERARIASPTAFNTNPCFQWDGESCRYGEITSQGCELHHKFWSKSLRALSLAGFVVSIVLFFVPGPRHSRHGEHRHQHHHQHHQQDPR